VVFSHFRKSHYAWKSCKIKSLAFGRLIAVVEVAGSMRFRFLIPGLLLTFAGFGQQYPPAAQYPGQYPQQGYPAQQQYPDAQYPQQNAQYPAQDQGAEPEPQDQPGAPVARLSVMNGDVSVRRGDSGEWVAAAMNAPLMAGDAISVGPGGSAEVQFDFANFVRIAGDSELRISSLENGRYQAQMARGMATWRVLRDGGAQAELSTPLVAVHPERDTAVRVEVAPDSSTRVIVRRGVADISHARGSQQLREGGMMLVRGQPDNPEYQLVPASARDGWDSWSDERDQYLLRAQSPQYVSQDVYGVEDLDQYGRWVQDPNYGAVWAPNVPASWSPYSNGQWCWEDYYGWTWVDYDPWGWAPFHYGTWFYRGGPYGWAWFPGARSHHYWWHPAMVGFFGFGGGGVGFGFGNIGWVPLAPFEVFHPWYGPGWFRGGRGVFVNYVHNVNVFNTFRNARFAGGVRAVRAGDFERGNFRNSVSVGRGDLMRASLVRGAVPISPSANNLRFSQRAAVVNGPRTDFGNQRFFSRMGGVAGAGIASRTPFTQQQSAIRSGFARPNFAGVAGQGGFRSSGQPSSGWQRFGEPNRSVQGFAPRANPGAGSWSRFGSPQTAPPSNQYSRPGFSGGGFGQQRPSAPAFEGRGNNGGGFSAPRPAPNYEGGGFRGGAPDNRGSAPAFEGRGNNGGGFSAPRPAPNYGGGGFRGGSAPAFRGGGNAPAFQRGGGGPPAFRGGGGSAPAFHGGGGGGAPHGGGGGGHPSGGGGGHGHR
jgi:hypothetical protein